MPYNPAQETGEGLPVFRSPLVDTESLRGLYRRTSSNEDEPQKPEQDDDDTGTYNSQQEREEEEAIKDHPVFHRHAEATNIELFYDLFFVANLTVFTNVHEVNDRYTLQQYAGYFALLWFTWYQVGLYDVRFSMDSIFERVCKTAHFGVMIGFAIVGPNFNVGAHPGETEGEELEINAFKSLTLFLMADRLVLVAQYLQSMWFTKGYRRAVLPMGMIAGVYFIAAMVYLGLFWTFHDGTDRNNSYIAWYVISIMETILATTISSVWRVISFKGTHLVQRMSLLTLIILGEGVMGLAKQCQTIAQTETFKFKPAIIGNIACAILILYFLYQLYFDWIEPEEHFGSIRQQIWSFLHFPLHLFLVGAVEGITQSLGWLLAYESFDRTANDLFKYFPDSNSTSPEEFEHMSTSMGYVVFNITEEASLKAKEYEEIEKILDESHRLEDAITYYEAANSSLETRQGAWFYIYTNVIPTVFEVAGFAIPKQRQKKLSDAYGNSTAPFDPSQITSETVDAEGHHATAEVNSVVKVFKLVYIYFFVCVGCVVIVCALIAALSKRHKSWSHFLRLGATLAIGVGLALLSTMALTFKEIDPNGNVAYSPFNEFIGSPWILPTVVLALFVIIVLNSVRWPKGKRTPTMVAGMHEKRRSTMRGPEQE